MRTQRQKSVLRALLISLGCGVLLAGGLWLLLKDRVPSSRLRVMEPPDVQPYAGEDWPDAEKKYAAMVTRLDTTVGGIFERLKKRFEPTDIISVVRHNKTLEMGNYRKAAEEGNFFLRGFNYLFIMSKPTAEKSNGVKNIG